MIHRPFSYSALGLMVIVALPGLANANPITINRDAVIPVIFDSALTVSDSQVGDRFTCHVDADRDLPSGTVFTGRITNIHVPRGDRPASMDLEFTSMVLPNGPAVGIRAIPIPLDKDLMRTSSDGRVYVKNDVRRQGEYVVGGALGGYLLGSLFHRRFTGLFLGTVAGMIAADSDRAKSMNVVVDKGTKMGALFNQDLVIDTGSRARGTWDRGWDGAHQGGDSGNSGGARGWDSAPAAPSAPASPASPPAPPAGSQPTTPSGTNGGWDSHRGTGGIPLPPASAVKDFTIRLGDQTLAFDGDPKPYYDGEILMVPVERTAGLFSLDCEKGQRNSIYIESADNSLKLEEASTSYRLNGKRGTLTRPVTLKGDVLYVPINVFAQMTTKDLILNGVKIDPKAN